MSGSKKALGVSGSEMRMSCRPPTARLLKSVCSYSSPPIETCRHQMSVQSPNDLL